MLFRKAVNYYAKFQTEHSYHVYNRTNNQESLFRSASDYCLFLEKYALYLSPFTQTYAYCLIINHFHFSITVNTLENILAVIQSVNPAERTAPQKRLVENPADESLIHAVIERQFTRLFTAYAMRFNQTQQRSGNLFHRPFKRLALANENHSLNAIYYIHYNPVKHGLVKDFTNYQWSSYQAFLSDKPTQLRRAEVLAWLGGREAFIAFHNKNTPFEEEDFALEG